MKDILNLVHVDDEHIELKKFAGILEDIPDVNLVGSFTDAVIAANFVKTNPVDFLITDIKMDGKDGLWLAKQLLRSSTRVAFLTSHSDYAVDAFEFYAIHYILKPYDKNTILSFIERCRKFMALESESSPEDLASHDNRMSEMVENFMKRELYPKRLFIYNTHKISVVELDNVICIKSSGPYSEFIMSNEPKLVASKSLKVYSDLLYSHPDFLRIHRSTIINKRYLKSIVRDKHSIAVVMKDDSKLDISTLRKDEVLKNLVI